MAARKGPQGPNLEDDEEICPICKSSRYLNPTMTFLINDCYHKMCASCVSRRFGLGPAECPYPNCRLTLRKHKFRTQTFPDLKVEREVDVRKRVAAVFNRRPEDFADLREYNDYLEDVERITFELLDEDKSVRDAAEKELSEHSAANKRLIAENLAKDREDKLGALSRAEQMRKQTLAARKAAALELEDQKAEQEELKRAKVRILAESKGPAEARKKYAEEARKIKARREKTREKLRREVEAEFEGGGGKRRRVAEEEPFNPLEGMERPNPWFVLKDDYDVPWLEDSKHDEVTIAGGYLLSQYFERSLYEAFSGITISIAEEKEKEEVEKAGKAGQESSLADRPVIVQDVLAA